MTPAAGKVATRGTGRSRPNLESPHTGFAVHHITAAVKLTRGNLICRDGNQDGAGATTPELAILCRSTAANKPFTVPPVY